MQQFEYRQLKTLKKYPGNPRIIKDQQFKTLCISIKENPDYFEARPIILSDRTGDLIIIAGNQRYEAAKANGLKEAPTFLMSGLTDEKEKEIVIRDNISNGDFDWDILANEWGDLPLADWGIEDNYECLNGSDKEKLTQTEKNIEPYKKIHVLVSVDVSSANEVTVLLDNLRKIQGVEIEQGAN